MEENIKIQSIRWYPDATADQMAALMEELARGDRAELLLLPNPDNDNLYRGILLSKYYTPELSQVSGVRETAKEGIFQYLTVEVFSLRLFFSSMIRRFRMARSKKEETEQEISDLFDGLEENPQKPPKAAAAEPWREKVRQLENLPILEFLRENTPVQIQRELDARVIGQPELTKAVADFLYYHALRQLHPELPQRPLLIAGPSGSGKTEVWRTAMKLYGDVFPIKIIDGSCMTCEGWSGNYKIDTFVEPSMVSGGILVVDEFDKLTKPKHSASGDNVALDMQAEFLKLVEGEYHLTEKKKQTNMTSKRMGFVLVGAFESLRQRKRAAIAKASARIGFRGETPAAASAAADCETLTDEDYIAYGIMPELVGRIAAKCVTAPLTEAVYLEIIRGPHSRVTLLAQILQRYGVELPDVVSDEALRAMVAASQANRTGVRWVAAQVENMLLEAIREKGLFPAECRQERREAVPISA